MVELNDLVADRKITSIEHCKDARQLNGARRRVFDLLLKNLALKKGTTKKMLMEVGGTEASKRARELRLGFCTQATKRRGEVLWVRYDEKTKFYWLESIPWEVWVKRHQENLRTPDPIQDTFLNRVVNS